MTCDIRAVELEDLARLRLFNDEAVPAVNQISLAGLDWFRVHAPYFRVALVDDRPAAFLVALTPGLDYASPNYQWFMRRGGPFVYIDRIIVTATERHLGIGRKMYHDLMQFAEPMGAPLVCEVNLRPPNPVSVLFHQRMGFREVGRQETEGGAKEVVLMERRVPSDEPAP